MKIVKRIISLFRNETKYRQKRNQFVTVFALNTYWDVGNTDLSIQEIKHILKRYNQGDDISVLMHLKQAKPIYQIIYAERV